MNPKNFALAAMQGSGSGSMRVPRAICRRRQGCSEFSSGPVPVSPKFDNVADFTAIWHPLVMKKDIAAHPGWRMRIRSHTFAHRMDAIHKWIGLDKMAVENLLASVIVPTIRPPNFQHVFRQYERQNYPAKELVYVFNGDTDDFAPIPANRNDIRVLTVPKEYTTGMVMNAGMAEASGECVFKFDDDDLYGAKLRCRQDDLFSGIWH